MYVKAAILEVPAAWYRLGELLEKKIISQTRPNQTYISYYKRAAIYGYIPAYSKLEDIYTNGVNVKRDTKIALYCRLKANGETTTEDPNSVIVEDVAIASDVKKLIYGRV